MQKVNYPTVRPFLAILGFTLGGCAGWLLAEAWLDRAFSYIHRWGPNPRYRPENCLFELIVVVSGAVIGLAIASLRALPCDDPPQ